MQRREFLWTSVAIAAGVMWPAGRSMAAFDPSPDDGWRVFDVTTRVEVLQPEGATRAWLPLPSVQEENWIRNMGNLWQGNALSARHPAQPGIRCGDALRGMDSGREAGHRGHQPHRHARPRRRPGPGRQGRAAVARRAAPQYHGHQAVAHRRHRQEDRARHHPRRQIGRGQGAGDLRVGGGQHLPQPEDARLRPGRHPLHAGVGRPLRQVRRPQRALRRPGARGRPAGARRVRHPRRGFALRLQEPGQERRHQQGAALPRRGVAHRARLGAGRPGRRAQGGAGGTARRPQPHG